MLDLVIDISDKVSEQGLSTQDVDSLTAYMLDRMVDMYTEKWEHLIDETLHTTKTEYRKAIMQVEYPDSHTAIIGMSPRESRFGFMLEEGADSFNMQEGFEKSDKRHEKKDGGWYLTIPMRHATSEAVMNSVVGTNLPKSVQEIAKQRTVTKQDLPAPFNEVKVHKIQINTGSIIEYEHKAPILEGLKRMEIGSNGEKRGGYYTFRRVSDKSDPNAWQHPGLEARKLMDKTLEQVTPELDITISQIFSDFMDLNFE